MPRETGGMPFFFQRTQIRMPVLRAFTAITRDVLLGYWAPQENYRNDWILFEKQCLTDTKH